MVASAEFTEQVIDNCLQAAEVNRAVPTRSGNLIQLPSQPEGEIVVAADLHGQRLTFRRLCQIAELETRRNRHLLMQEVCHGGPLYPSGQGCMSHLLLEDVTRLKIDYPDRFHFILSNHEMAELTDFPIAKSNQMLNLQFRKGIQQMYGDEAGRVRNAYLEFIRSCPLAVRLANGIFICHSTPEEVDREGFDAGVFHRRLTNADMLPAGDAFRLVWGRDFRGANAEAFARIVDAKIVLQGHEPCPDGYNVPNDRQIVLDSCGPNACYAILPLDQPLALSEVIDRIERLP